MSGFAANFDGVQNARQAAFFGVDDVDESITDYLLVFFGNVRIEFLNDVVMRADNDDRRIRCSGLYVHQPLEDFVDASVAVGYSPYYEVQTAFR